jgi:hypothetical protein
VAAQVLSVRMGALGVGETRYVRSADVVFRQVGEEMLLVPVKRVVDLQCLFTLNETGRAVWNLLAQPRTLEEVARAITTEFEVDAQDATEDARVFVEALVREGCAVVEPQDA